MKLELTKDFPSILPYLKRAASPLDDPNEIHTWLKLGQLEGWKVTHEGKLIGAMATTEVPAGLYIAFLGLSPTAPRGIIRSLIATLDDYANGKRIFFKSHRKAFARHLDGVFRIHGYEFVRDPRGDPK